MATIKLYDLLNESVNEITNLNETKINDYIKEIDSAGNRAALEAKISKCEEAIQERKKKIEMSESLEEMKDMVDGKKVKNLQKEVTSLEKAKQKFENLLEKMTKKENPEEEVITEDDPNISIDNKEEPNEKPEEEKSEEEGTEGGYGEGELEEHMEPDGDECYGNEEEMGDENSPEEVDIHIDEQFSRMQKLAGINEAKKKPSTGLTKKKKSAIVKKAKSGKDVGKKGKNFEKVEKAAEKEYGSKEVAKKVAGAALWKGAAKRAHKK